MKGILERAVIVGCDVLLDDGHRCPRLLILNGLADRDDLVDDKIDDAGWMTLATPAGDTVEEHACLEHRP